MRIIFKTVVHFLESLSFWVVVAKIILSRKPFLLFEKLNRFKELS